MRSLKKDIRKCQNKILWYTVAKTIFPIPSFKQKCQKKILKYDDRLTALNKENTNFSNDLLLFAKNLSLINSVNLRLKNLEQKKVLIIGCIDAYNEESLYTNVILKNLDYKNSKIHLYNKSQRCVIEYNNQEYLQNVSYRDILYYSDLDLVDASIYDICIYLTDLTNDIVLPLSMSKISYIYNYKLNTISEMQSNIINRNFDAFLTPYENINNKISNIFIPKFTIPLAFETSFFEKMLHNEERQITYIANIHDALNIAAELYKIQNFLRDHQFYINILYLKRETNINIDYEGNEIIQLSLLKRYSSENIKISKADTLQLFCEVKKYANYSSGFIFSNKYEDFICNPRLVLAAGKTIFIPDDFNIDANIDGIYKYKNPKDLVKSIKDYIKNKDKIDSKYIQRKEYAKKFSKASNAMYYYLLTNYVNTTDKKFKFLTIEDKNLKGKYKKYIGKEEFTHPNNLTIIPVNDAGFFSVYNKHVSFLAHKKDNEFIIPDWRISKFYQNIYKYWRATTPGSWCYGKYEDGNIFLKLFEYPYSSDVIDYDLYESDIMYDYADKIVDCPEYNFENEPFLTYIYSYELPKDEKTFSNFRKKYHDVVEKYMKPQPYIQQQIDSFKEKYIKGHFCISIHVRCRAHAAELLEETLFENYAKQIDNILKNNSISKQDKEWRLFIATDNNVALNYFKNLYPNNLVYQNNVDRLTEKQEQEYNNIKKKKNKDVGGYELQQRNATSENTRSIKLAIDVLTDAYLLAAGDYFIYQNSNVSTAVSYLNPDIKMVYCK